MKDVRHKYKVIGDAKHVVCTDKPPECETIIWFWRDVNCKACLDKQLAERNNEAERDRMRRVRAKRRTI